VLGLLVDPLDPSRKSGHTNNIGSQGIRLAAESRNSLRLIAVTNPGPPDTIQHRYSASANGGEKVLAEARAAEWAFGRLPLGSGQRPP